jgi:hypothetical protein
MDRPAYGQGRTTPNALSVVTGSRHSEIQMRVLDGVQSGLRRDLARLQLTVGTEDLEVEPTGDVVPDQPDLSPVGGGAGFKFALHAYRCTTVSSDWLVPCDESYETLSTGSVAMTSTS